MKILSSSITCLYPNDEPRKYTSKLQLLRFLYLTGGDIALTLHIYTYRKYIYQSVKVSFSKKKQKYSLFGFLWGPKDKNLFNCTLLNLEIVCFCTRPHEGKFTIFWAKICIIRNGTIWVRNFFALSHVLIAVGFDDMANKYLLLVRLPRCSEAVMRLTLSYCSMSNQF